MKRLTAMASRYSADPHDWQYHFRYIEGGSGKLLEDSDLYVRIVTEFPESLLQNLEQKLQDSQAAVGFAIVQVNDDGSITYQEAELERIDGF